MQKLIALAAAALFCSGSVLAQSATATSSGGGKASAQSTSNGKTATASSELARGDRKLLEDLIEANAAEVQTGKMALEKAQGQEAKSFAQKMVDDHTKALKELQDLAQAKGVTPKDDTDLQHKALAKALGGLDGERFDVQYMKRVGVDDHKRTLQLLEKTQKNAKDADLKAMAQKMMPVVQGHLKTAQSSHATGDKHSKADTPQKTAKQ
jgi:putative membrane protein